MRDTLLKVKGLKKFFPVRRGILSEGKGYVYAVDGVSFDIKRGETLGLVGESGCGKTTTGKTILRLIEPTDGSIEFDGIDICRLKGDGLRRLRSRMQIIFQDPYSSLNPRMRIGSIVGEPLDIHKVAKGSDKEERVVSILKRVGLKREDINRYPYQLSGGERQRIGIARAIILSPDLVVGDEPVSALDASIQAQVINLLEELQEEFHLSYLIISHDLSLIEYMSDRVAVMYLGKFVEIGDSKNLYISPLHPYTEALLSAIPLLDPTIKREKIILRGEPPSPMNPPSGCYFHSRCSYRFDDCKMIEPVLKEVNRGHFVACHLRG
ncbi:MAG: ATP-binding cassette domain-containing protein [Nitrospinae bacterium]|nr:ATP-binding cassette domain-containing protein [Nitrospinota bacterium]